jgi:pimeloyl-ACP methyl ester carboxylesterase
MPTLSHDQVSLYFEQSGSGPDIVWISGGGGLPEWTWVPYQLPAFPDFRHTVFHNRGIGRTTCEQPGPWTIADFARDTAALIEHACDRGAIVVGKSMGGLIAIQLALERPDVVRLAIPMGVMARSTGWIHDYMRAEIEYRRNGGSLSGLLAVCHYASTLNPADELGDEESWTVLRRQYAGFGATEDNQNERSLILQWEACDTFDCVDRLPECSVPMHVVAFGQDVQAPPVYGRQVADLCPTAEFHMLEGHGHASLWGPLRAGEVNRLLHTIIEGGADG